MKVYIKWLMSGNVTPLEEIDDLLHPGTSILELKGLIQVTYGYPAKEILLAANKHLLENYSRLSDCGIVDEASAEEIEISAHVVPQSSMEGSNLNNGGGEEEEDYDGEDDEDDAAIQEFSHEDMVLAMKMLGKNVPIAGDRLQELRKHAPRAAPQYLNLAAQREPQAPALHKTESFKTTEQTYREVPKPQEYAPAQHVIPELPEPEERPVAPEGWAKEHEAMHQEQTEQVGAWSKDQPKATETTQPSETTQTTQPPPAATTTTSAASGPKFADGTYGRLVEIFKFMEHGLRRDNVDEELQVVLPQPKREDGEPMKNLADPYTYWDLRLPERQGLQSQCGAGEIVVEIFYFGEFNPLKDGTLKGGFSKFQALVEASLQRHAIRAECVMAPREAGCMYPLVAVPIKLSATDCWQLGERVFEKFGRAAKSAAYSSSTNVTSLQQPSSTGLTSSGAKQGAGGGDPAGCAIM